VAKHPRYSGRTPSIPLFLDINEAGSYNPVSVAPRT
jgi:hypothetical protein